MIFIALLLVEHPLLRTHHTLFDLKQVLAIGEFFKKYNQGGGNWWRVLGVFFNLYLRVLLSELCRNRKTKLNKATM